MAIPRPVAIPAPQPVTIPTVSLGQRALMTLTNSQPVIPGMFPITVTLQTDKDTIPLVVYRSYFGVHAVDMRTGSRRWEADSRFAPDKAIAEPTIKWINVDFIILSSWSGRWRLLSR